MGLLFVKMVVSGNMFWVELIGYKESSVVSVAIDNYIWGYLERNY